MSYFVPLICRERSTLFSVVKQSYQERVVGTQGIFKYRKYN